MGSIRSGTVGGGEVRDSWVKFRVVGLKGEGLGWWVELG